MRFVSSSKFAIFFYEKLMMICCRYALFSIVPGGASDFNDVPDCNGPIYCAVRYRMICFRCSRCCIKFFQHQVGEPVYWRRWRKGGKFHSCLFRLPEKHGERLDDREPTLWKRIEGNN